jgi:hypothetical protein
VGLDESVGLVPETEFAWCDAGMLRRCQKDDYSLSGETADDRP